MRLDNITVSPIDDRDYLAETPVGVEIQEVFSLRRWLHGTEKQGAHNSCVGTSLVINIELLMNKMGNPADLSISYAYWCLRAMAGIQNIDEGAYPRHMGKVATGPGFCSEKTWPYTSENINKFPPEKAFTEGFLNNKWRYERIPLNGVRYGDRNTAIKTQIALGFPVLLTLAINEQFFYLSGPWQEHTWDYKPSANNKYVGLHQVVAIGFDDRAHHKRFECVNPWGPDWGDKSFFGLEYNPAECDMWQWQTIREAWVVKPE